MLLQLQVSEGPQIQIQAEVFLHIPVHAENCHAAVISQCRRSVHQRNSFIVRTVIDRRVHNRLQGGAAAVAAHMHVGIEDRLRPASAAVPGHNRRNHVHQLRQACHLHPVRVAQEGDQHAACQQGVLKVVDVLQQRQGGAPLFLLPDLLVLFIGVIPDVPLVKGQVDLLLLVLLALHRVADGDHRMDKVIQVHAPGQEAGGIVGGIAVVTVQGNIVDVLIALVQHRQFPVAESGHLGGGGTAGHQFDGGIHPLHHLGGFVGDMAVFRCGFMSHLPGAVHLVAKAPHFNAQRILSSVPDPHITELASALVVGVFHDVPRVFRSPGAQVDGIHDFAADLFRPVCKFMQAHLVAFRCEPGQVQALRPQLPRTDGILPVEAGDKVSAGIPDDRNADLADLFNHVFPESGFIRVRMTGFIDTAVDRAAKVLDKGTEDARVHLADPVVSVQDHGCFFHGFLLLPRLSPSHCRRSVRQ